VLEDSLARSLGLAAGMDTRGYGRAAGETPRQRALSGGLLLAGLCGLGVGVYAVLDLTAPRLLALPMLVAGAVVALAGIASAGRRVERSRYRPDRWLWPESAVAASGAAVGVTYWWLARELPLVAHPGVDSFPSLTAAALLGGLLGALPAVLAPPPTLPLATRRVLEVAR
jgi:energy-coupling factor transport system permease protein